MTRAHAESAIEQLRWGRLDVNGQAHTHAFARDGDEKRFTDVEVRWFSLSFPDVALGVRVRLERFVF